MGVHKLTTADLEGLGRWKSKSKDPAHCPDYMVRTSRNKNKRKRPENLSEKEDTFSPYDVVTFFAPFFLLFLVPGIEMLTGVGTDF